MKHVRTLAALMAYALVSACTDYATFVTATNIGINADVKTEQLNIGYTRAELFHGPGYPSEGAAPSAVGYISSDLSPFSPNIKQLYATGTAAELVTQNQPPRLTEEPSDTLTGPRRPFFFGTGTDFGLKVSFAGDIPSSVRMGFNREELSIIPMQQADPLSGQPDKYASVLASINMDGTITSMSGTNVRPTQFFATGAAARNLAKRDEIRGIFDAQAKTAVEQAATQEAIAKLSKIDQSNRGAISAYFSRFPVTQFAAARKALLDNSALPPTNPKIIEMSRINNEDDFIAYLAKNPDVASLLSKHIPRAAS